MGEKRGNTTIQKDQKLVPLNGQLIVHTENEIRLRKYYAGQVRIGGTCAERVYTREL